MIPKHHPRASAAESGDETRADSLWSPAWYPVESEALERWLLDQVSLSAGSPIEKWQILAELAPVLLAVRAAILAGMPLARVLAEAVPKGQPWRAFETNGTFSIWKCGRNDYAIQIRQDGDGVVRWQAGHSFRPFAACCAPLGKGKRNSPEQEPELCLKAATVLMPVCLKHVGLPFRRLLLAEGLVETVGEGGQDQGLGAAPEAPPGQRPATEGPGAAKADVGVPPPPDAPPVKGQLELLPCST